MDMNKYNIHRQKQSRNRREAPGFESPYPVAVSQIGPREWELVHPMRYRTYPEKITVVDETDPSTWRLTPTVYTVPEGGETDFGSQPPLISWLVPSTTGIAATVLHDHLWRVVVPAGEMTYREADKIFRDALQELYFTPGRKVSKVRAYTMWAGVRWGALLSRRGGWRGWWRDAPAVLAITVLLLPFAAAAVCLLPLVGIYKLVEWVIG